VRPVCLPILLAVFSWLWIAAAGLGAREIALAATIATVLIAGFGLWLTMRGIRDQLWLQTFQEYTRRYSEIVRDLPSDSRRPGSGFTLDALDVEEHGRVLNAARAYLNLTSEEFFLHARGRIDDETWRIWKTGIIETVRLPWLQLAWHELEIEYAYFPEYCGFIGECLSTVPPAQGSD
jgi:hypothetical protein